MGVSNIITFDAHDPRVQNADAPDAASTACSPSYQILKALFRKEKDLQIGPGSHDDRQPR